MVSLDKAILHLIYKSRFVGKTTIADALVASNGIISQRLAGKVSLLYHFNVKACTAVPQNMSTRETVMSLNAKEICKLSKET